MLCVLRTQIKFYPSKPTSLESYWSTALPWLLVWSPVCFFTYFTETNGVRILQDKNTFPECSQHVPFLSTLLLVEMTFKVSQHIMDNKHCAEGKKAKPGLNVVASTWWRRMKISHCEPSSLKAWAGLGPGNSTAKNSLLRKPLKLAPSTASLPTLALLLSIFCPEPFPELLGVFSACLLSTRRQWKGCCCCFILTVTRCCMWDVGRALGTWGSGSRRR